MDCALLENVIPETKYGYWIDATGQFISVNFHEHAEVLQDLGIGFYYADAFEKGWVRVVAIPSSIKVSIQFNSEYITKAAFSALFSWLSKENKTEFYGEDSQTDSYSDLPSNVGPVPIGKGRVWVRALMKENQLPEQLTETVIPETKYGYWITAAGEFITVSFHGHADVARRHGFNPPYNALRAGWIRIIAENPSETEIMIDSEHASKLALSALFDWMYEFKSKSFFKIDDDVIGTNGYWSKSRARTGSIPVIEAETFIKKRMDIAYREKRAAKKNEELTETIIPETKYGYWIDTNGTFIPVPLESHSNIARMHGFKEKYDAIDNGWVRIISAHRAFTEIAFNSTNITKPALTALINWMYEFRSQSEFHIDDETQGVVPSVSKYIDGPIETEKYIKNRIDISYRKKRAGQRNGNLLETIIPETDYGYWITDKGEFIKVPFQDHEEVARALGFDSKFGAINNGWIRVVSETSKITDILFDSTNILKIALAALIKWMYEFRRKSVFHLDDDEINNGYWMKTRASLRVSDPIQAEEFIKKRIDIAYREKRASQRNGNLLETIIPHSEYGYWITDKGEFIPVGPYAHEEVARALGFEKESYVYVDAYKSGWIRIVGTPTDDRLIAEFDARYITRHALGTLFRWVNESIFTSFSCTDVDCDGDRLSPHSKISLGNGVYVHAKELAPTDQRRFMGFIRLATQNAKQKFTESMIPETDYGYWVDENGRFIPVSSREGHSIVLYDLINSPNNDDAFQIGYIRVITTNRDIMVQYDPLRVSKRVLNEVIRWASSENVRNYIVSLKNEMGTHKENFIRTTELNQFVTFLRKSIAKELTENVLPESKYGYWITKSGEYIPVGYQQHETELIKIGMVDSAGYGSYTKAFQDGWIRVVAKGSLTADIDSRYVTDRAIRALNNLIKIKGYDMYMSASDKFAYKNKEIGYYVASVDLLEFNRFIRSRLAIGRKEAAEAANSPKSIFEAILRF